MKTVYPFSVPNTDLATFRKFMWQTFKKELSVRVKSHAEPLKAIEQLDASIDHQLYYSFWCICDYDTYDTLVSLPNLVMTRLFVTDQSLILLVGGMIYDWKHLLSGEPESIMKQVTQYFISWGLSDVIRQDV